MTGKHDEALRKRLRRQLDGDASELMVAASDMRWLLDELGRLHQSNERLRRQNRKLRLRAERGDGDGDGDGGGAGEAERDA